MVSKTPPREKMSTEDWEKLQSLPKEVEEDERPDDGFVSSLEEIAPDTEIRYHVGTLPDGKKYRFRSLEMGELLRLQELDGRQSVICELMKTVLVDGKGRRWLTDEMLEDWKKRSALNFSIMLQDIERRCLPGSDLQSMAEDAAGN